MEILHDIITRLRLLIFPLCSMISNQFKTTQVNKSDQIKPLVKVTEADVQDRHGTSAMGFGQTVAPRDAM
jgi:hypothetical protein